MLARMDFELLYPVGEGVQAPGARGKRATGTSSPTAILALILQVGLRAFERPQIQFAGLFIAFPRSRIDELRAVAS